MRSSSQLYDNMTFRFICGAAKFYQSFIYITPAYKPIHHLHLIALALPHLFDTPHKIRAIRAFPLFDYGLVKARIIPGKE
jgi:hypothetical protein